MEKKCTQVRAVVMGLALFVAVMSVAPLLINAVELSLYLPFSEDAYKKDVFEDYLAFQDMLASLMIVIAIFTILGTVFAVLSTKIKKLRLPAAIVSAVLALMFFIMTIAVHSSAFFYITEDWETVETPIYASGMYRYSAAMALGSSFVTLSVQPCICFAAIAICSLLAFIDDVRERKAARSAPAPVAPAYAPVAPAPVYDPTANYKNGYVSPVAPAPGYASTPTPMNTPDPEYTPDSAPTAPVVTETKKICKHCGAPIGDGAMFCTSCGNKVE